MSEAKHTPGPWVEFWHAEAPYPGIEANEFSVLVWGDERDLGTCGIQGRTPEEVTANAHLIAAAPDLLDALEEAVKCGMVPKSSALEGGASRHARQAQVSDMIRAAIAKAKGDPQ